MNSFTKKKHHLQIHGSKLNNGIRSQSHHKTSVRQEYEQDTATLTQASTFNTKITKGHRKNELKMQSIEKNKQKP